MILVSAPSITSLEVDAVSDAVRSGWVSSKGEYIERFEKAFAELCGAPYATSAANGTVALHLALMALGIGEGDEVILPTFTFVGTASPVVYVRARPVFVDADPRHWCMDPDQIERNITERTKAIIVVHLYGHPADMDAIREIAARHRIAVIEDAAEAHGARYKGLPVGGLSDISIFSFYGNKIITTGEGGALVSHNSQLIERASFLKNHGMDPHRKYWHPELGYNYRMTNMQAALGVAQLSRISELLEKKRRISERYKAALNGNIVQFQDEMPWALSANWMVSVVPQNVRTEDARDAVMAKLLERGIETRPLFYPVHRSPIYQAFVSDDQFPVSNDICCRGINLPSGVDLSDDEIDYVSKELIAALRLV